jgi:hypothetical protein
MKLGVTKGRITPRPVTICGIKLLQIRMEDLWRHEAIRTAPPPPFFCFW